MDGAWPQGSRIDLVEAALKRRLFVGHQPVDDLDILAKTRDAFLRAPVRDAHHAIGRIDLQPDAEPDIEPRFQRRVGLVKWALLLSLAALIILLGQANLLAVLGLTDK